jgi:hypothetical protein
MTGKQQEDRHGPREVDLRRPSAARMYDWYLGGSTNYAVDREFGRQMLGLFPIVKPVAIANRHALHRIVRHLVRRGIRQFIDIGSGVPTMGNVHEVAGELAPDSKVVYVDNEPIAVAHSRILLQEHGDPARHAVVHADLRDPEELWEQAFDTGVLDPGEPIGLLMIAVLHFITGDREAEHALHIYRDLLPGGSYLAITHATVDGADPRRAAEYSELVARYDDTSNPVRLRTWAEVGNLFGDFELLEPGVCWIPEWHPGEAAPGIGAEALIAPNESVGCVGVARKPDVVG